MLCWLLIDSAAYFTRLEYVLTLLAYTMGSVVLFFFLCYINAYFNERAAVKHRIFLIPQILALLCAAASVVEFAAGRIVVYENGIAVKINALPVYFSVIQIGALVFTVAVAIGKRKAVGWKAIALFCLFFLSTAFGIATASLFGEDYTVAFSAVAMMIIACFLQEHKTRVRMENAFAAVTALILLYLILQSGAYSRTPSIEVEPDNCYDETLHVATDEDYLPYSFVDDDGRETGHDVEMIALLANRMHVNLDLRFVPWNEGIRSLAEGKTDVLLNCDYFDDLGGMDGLLMTEPVSTDDFVVYSKAEIHHIDELYGRKIAVMENANCLSYTEMYRLDNNCVFMPSNAEALRAVEDGTADCAIVRHIVGEAILKTSGYRDISGRITIGSSFTCIGIGQNNRDLLQRMNDAIEAMKLDGSLEDRRHIRGSFAE